MDNVVVLPVASKSVTRFELAYQVHHLFLKAVRLEESPEGIPQAIECYEKIIALDSKYAPAYINLGTIRFKEKNFGEAEKLYRLATVVDPGYALAFFDLGNVLEEVGRLDEAIHMYEQALALIPTYADAHYNLALAYECKNSPLLALSHWKKYCRLDRSGRWSAHAKNQIKKVVQSLKDERNLSLLA